MSGPHTRWRTIVLLNLASIVERADEQVLPAVYNFISKSLHASPSQLGTLTLCRALVQALSSPISGILGDKYDRTHIVAFGCFLWGIMTALIGVSTSVHQAMVWCGVNGVGLALVIPCVQSLTADYNPAEMRGRAFGIMAFTAAMGGLVGGFFATNVGHFQPLGIEGWRFAFYFVAAISLIVCGLVLKYAADPRKKAGLISPLLLGSHGSEDGLSGLGRQPSPSRQGEYGSSPSLKGLATAGKSAIQNKQHFTVRLREMWVDVKSVLRIPTFQILILQGIVGSTPWNGMVFFTMWLQLMGFSDFTASSLMAIFAGGCACGSYLGGVIGDFLSKGYPNAGRVVTCQLSVIMGLPLSCLVLKGLPTAAVGENTSMNTLAVTYGVALFTMGIAISWCGTNNSAIFAEIVPEQKRSTVYAFDRSFEGAVAACAAPLVVVAGGVSHNPENAGALSSALLVCLVVPWGLCFVFYFGLYRTYAKDRIRRDRSTTLLHRMQDP